MPQPYLIGYCDKQESKVRSSSFCKKTVLLAALGFSTADLADTSLLIVWYQSLSLDPAGETLRLTYQKTSGDPVQLVDELHYGNALGGADSLSARLADTLWQYAPPPALSRLSHSASGNTFRSSSFGTRGFKGGGIQIPFLPGARPVYAQHVRGKRLYELKKSPIPAPAISFHPGDAETPK